MSKIKKEQVDKLIFKHQSRDQEISYMVIDEVEAYKIVRHFAVFLKGVTFHDVTIARAFRDIAEELNPNEETDSSND